MVKKIKFYFKLYFYKSMIFFLFRANCLITTQCSHIKNKTKKLPLHFELKGQETTEQPSSEASSPAVVLALPEEENGTWRRQLLTFPVSHLHDQQSFREGAHQPPALGARVSDPLSKGPPTTQAHGPLAQPVAAASPAACPAPGAASGSPDWAEHSGS